MKAIDIARTFAAVGDVAGAYDAYMLSLHENTEENPAEEMEAAVYLFQAGGDHKIPYTCFQRLYNAGHYQEDCLNIMTKAFYEPNVKELQIRYARNCKLLSKYPYLFRKDFPSFDELPVRFFPFDDKGYIPFYPAKQQFGDYLNFNYPVISRNFFHDLEKPILAQDVFSQYELEYLNDNVRNSEDIGRENHIYLHYTDWGRFCSYLQCLNMRPLLKEKKLVFLIDSEVEQYPIDFKSRFGIDYSDYPVRPVKIREITRMIWHTQLSTHNGGDMFNEVFDGHPNLVASSSLMFDSVESTIQEIESMLREAGNAGQAVKRFSAWEPRLISELYLLKNRTEKDILVGMLLRDTRNGEKKNGQWLDNSSRIVPAIFFQPHFANILYSTHTDKKGRTTLVSKQYDKICSSPIFKGFKYIKTFTPMRRMTTSYGATIKFMYNWESAHGGLMGDVVSQRILNRSFMVDPQNRLFQDSILVRFEDAKLNPKATFTALVNFLDIPWAQSMTYGSVEGKPIEYTALTDVFDTATVYRAYDEYANDSDRYYIEYFLRDAYEQYGYSFQYYDGKPVSIEQIEALVASFTNLDGYTSDLWMKHKRLENADGQELTEEERQKALEASLAAELEKSRKRRISNARILMQELRFINEKGQPLYMMPQLKLDETLLEQPLYH